MSVINQLMEWVNKKTVLRMKVIDCEKMFNELQRAIPTCPDCDDFRVSIYPPMCGSCGWSLDYEPRPYTGPDYKET